MKKYIFYLIFLFIIIATIPTFAKKITIAEKLHDAANVGDLKTVKKILRKYPNLINHKSELFEFTPLMSAIYGAGCKKRDKKIKNQTNIEEVAIYLINNKANLTTRSSTGLTPLHHAAAFGLTKVTKLLLSHKEVKVNVFDKCKNYPLHYAIEFGHLEIVKMLIAKGAKIDESMLPSAVTIQFKWKDNRKDIPLIADILIKHGAQINKSEALHCAINFAFGYNNEDVIELLIKRGANINLKDKHFGNTPLHYAAMLHDTVAATILIQHGAFVNIQNKDGKTPLDLAFEWQESARKGETGELRAKPEMYKDVIFLLQETERIKQNNGN